MQTTIESSLSLAKNPAIEPQTTLTASSTPASQHATAPAGRSVEFLRQFTDAEILKQIDTRRTHLFLRQFTLELSAAGLAIPLSTTNQMDEDYFNCWLALISHPACPPGMLQTLLTIETAALPKNQAAVDDAINRRIPNISPGVNRLDHVLELWFHAPDEFKPFQSSSCSSSPSGAGSRIETDNSEPPAAEISATSSPPLTQLSPPVQSTAEIGLHPVPSVVDDCPSLSR